jgi:glycosyltransferase involved in cell wall biosynthesis
LEEARTVLYISYDGMTDPLGQSQVLPYLTGLAARGHEITLLSAEKKARFAADSATVQRLCDAAGIDWQPIRYHKRPPLLSSVADTALIERRALQLHRERCFDIIHCRSYLPAIVGHRLKRKVGTRFLFDMRGFWADERVDGGLWKLDNRLFAAVYRYFKRRESEWLRSADHVVTLTQEGQRILLARPDRDKDGPPISVIPCCVDFDSFPAVDRARRDAARLALGIVADARVAAYLGSVGTWYMLDEMFDFFKVQLERRPEAIFLFLTRDEPGPIIAAAAARGIGEKSLRIRGANRQEVPQLLAAADYGLFFIKPVFSKKASSPTKMGELLALELPMVTNGGVGDVETILGETGAGAVVEAFTAEAYGHALDALDQSHFDMGKWRARARHWFDLAQGLNRFDAIYLSLAKRTRPSTGR